MTDQTKAKGHEDLHPASFEDIARSWILWVELADSESVRTREHFDALTVAERIEVLRNEFAAAVMEGLE